MKYPRFNHQRPPRWPPLWDSSVRVVAAALICILPLSASADVLPANDIVAPEFRTVKMTVVDESGKPVQGAMVVPRVLVSQDDLHNWDEEAWGPLPTGASNHEGRTELRVPTRTRDQKRILTVHWSVSHQNYVAASFKSNSVQQSVACQLKSGRRIAVSAIDGQTGGRLRSDTFAVLSGHTVDEKWIQAKSGILVSDGLATSRRMLRIVHLPPGKPARYSKAIDLSFYQEKPRIFLRDIAVHPGSRIEGKIDDEVPRPVQQGIVSAFVIQGQNEWHDMAEIRPDGTFAIGHLPQGEIVQLTASCENWVSSDPTLAELEAAGMQEKSSRLQRSRVYPQIVRLENDVTRTVVRMEPATTCRIEVVETNGTPVEGARVRLIPYQGSFDGRSHVFGHGESTRQRLLSDAINVTAQQRIELGIARDIRGRYTANTGSDGIAEISSLPGGPDGSPAMTSFVVTHPNYFAANSGGLGDQGSSRAALYSGRTTEVLVRMKRR